MGLFKKKKEVKEEVPRLPELPALPRIPNIEKKLEYKKDISQLPSYPNNSLGNKFSQNTIKDAVSGEEEGDEDFYANEFDPKTREMKMMQKSIREPSTKEIPLGFREAAKSVKENEPVFIRIDKFEESLKIFEDTKKQLNEIEKLLAHTKNIKEQEEKELQDWENDLRNTKAKIEKIDKDLFSKLE